MSQEDVKTIQGNITNPSDTSTKEPEGTVWTDKEIEAVAAYVSILRKRELGQSDLIDQVEFGIIMPGLPHFGINGQGIALDEGSNPVRLKQIILQKKFRSDPVMGVGFTFHCGDNVSPLTSEEAQATQGFIDAAIENEKYGIHLDWSGRNEWIEVHQLKESIGESKMLRLEIKKFDLHGKAPPSFSYKLHLTGINNLAEPFIPEELNIAKQGFYKALITPRTDVGFRLVHL
jgi:hypothetical protein